MPQRSVLLVDDDPQVSQMICAALHANGITPVWAESMRAAAEALPGQDFSHVLLDLHLPDSPPEKTIANIRCLRPWAEKDLAVVTGTDVTPSVQRVCLENGAGAVISKNDPHFFRKVLAFVST